MEKLIHKYTCVILGDEQVGKSDLPANLMGKSHGSVTKNVGEFKVERTVDESNCSLNILVINDQQDDSKLMECFAQADIFMLCFSVVLPESFNHIKTNWLPLIKRYSHYVPVILVGTMIDLRSDRLTIENLVKEKKSPISYSTAELFAKTKGLKYFECSAATGEGVKHLFEQSALAAYKKHNKKGCIIS